MLPITVGIYIYVALFKRLLGANMNSYFGFFTFEFCYVLFIFVS